MKNFSLILSLLVLLIHLEGKAQTYTINVGGVQRNYIVYVPKNLGEKRPLLISCHGMNQDAAYQKNMLQIESIADTAKFVTVFPNGIDKGWDIGGDRDINYVKALINEMITKYDIDPNRVYLSGFSMGGMFTYHAMNRIPDLIAAFAPISGYPMGGTTANANVRPLPIIHTHGTSDDVVNFGGVSGALNVWIKHNGCPTKDEITKNYRGAAHVTRHVWGPGNNNVEVVLLEMAGKGHWISNDIIKTGDEIWRFCKRFSLELKEPTVRITAPKDGLTYITFGGASDVPDLTISATASDPDGEIKKVAFYDGSTLLAEFDQAPYNYTLTGLTAGEHSIVVKATDDEGRTGSSKIIISVQEPTGFLVLHKAFSVEGSVPEGWSTYDGNEKRTGFASGFTSGSRVFHFTGEKHDFEWGLYTRNVNGNAKAGYARYADTGTSVSMTLYPGQYQFYYRVCNWNQENFSPITMALETLDGKQVFVETYTPKTNIGNTASNSFSGTELKNKTFDVTEKGRYVWTFYTADAPWADLVIGQATFRYLGELSDIKGVNSSSVVQTQYYNLAGQQVKLAKHGPYIEKTIRADGTTSSRVIMVK